MAAPLNYRFRNTSTSIQHFLISVKALPYLWEYHRYMKGNGFKLKKVLNLVY